MWVTGWPPFLRSYSQTQALTYCTIPKIIWLSASKPSLSRYQSGTKARPILSHQLYHVIQIIVGTVWAGFHGHHAAGGKVLCVSECLRMPAPPKFWLTSGRILQSWDDRDKKENFPIVKVALASQSGLRWKIFGIFF